jgi:hypothetical protein
LLIPSSFCLSPMECSRGTTPIQAANSRPFAEGRSIADRRDERGRYCGSDAGDWLSTDLVGLNLRGEVVVRKK